MRCWNWSTKRFSPTVRRGCYEGKSYSDKGNVTKLNRQSLYTNAEIGIEGFFSYKYLTISSECTASLLTEVSKKALVVRKRPLWQLIARSEVYDRRECQASVACLHIRISQWASYPPLYSWAQELDDAQHSQRSTIKCDSLQHCRNSPDQQFEAVWVFPVFTGRGCRASLWPGAWSEWPCVLKWSAAVVGQAAWRLQKENLKFAGAGFGSSSIFARWLWLSGYGAAELYREQKLQISFSVKKAAPCRVQTLYGGLNYSQLRIITIYTEIIKDGALGPYIANGIVLLVCLC